MLESSKNIRRIKRLIIVIVAVLLLVILLFPIFVSKQKLTTDNSSVNNNHSTQNTLQKPIILGQDSQGREYKISADELLQQTQNIAQLKQIKGYITNSDNSIIKFITNHAEYNNSQQVLDITTQTNLEWVGKYNIITEELQITLPTKDINAKQVMISDDNNTILSSDKMHIDGNSQVITLQDNVNIKISDIKLLEF